MSNNSIIEHRGCYYYVEFREEYLIICLNCSYKKAEKSKASPYCKALILAILESWTNDKRGKGEDLAIYMTYPQWVEAMYGMFSRCVIIDSLDELIGEGLTSREKYRMYGKDTYKYLLNYRELNHRIKLLPERDPKQKHPKIDASKSRRDNSHDPSKSRRETRLKVDVDPSKSRHNIESTKKPNTESKEGTNATADSTNPNASLSFPPSFFSLSPEDQLTYLEAQAACIKQTMIAKETASSSKPSSDPTLSTELPTGVDNEQAAKPTDASLIVTGTTANRQAEAAPDQGESVTTRNASNEANTSPNAEARCGTGLSPEEQRIQGYWQELGFEADITPKLKEHWGKLTKHTKSFEQFKSLYEHTRQQIENNPEIKNKRVSPGNLTNANNLNGWKQAQMPVSKPETTSSKTASVSGMRNYTFEPEKTTTTETPEGKRKLPEFKLRRPNKTASVAQ